MRPSAFFVALVLLAGCDTSPGSVATEDVTLTNAADRPVAASVYSREALTRIDLADALRADEFEAVALGVGETVREPLGEYSPGEDFVVLVYARRDQPTPWIQDVYGPGAAEPVAHFDVSWDELRESGYQVVVRDAGGE